MNNGRPICLMLAVCTLLLFVAAAPHIEAQQSSKVPRIAVLGPGYRDAFEEGLRQFGYVEGKNIQVEWPGATERSEQFPEVAAEFVRRKVDVIVAVNNPAVAAAQKATTTIPIVMVIATDPVRLGFVTSLARPTGNITGLSMQTPELAGKRLQLLKDVVPNLKRVALLWDPTEPGRKQLVEEAEVVAPGLGLEIQSFEVRHVRDLEGAFAAMVKARANAVVVFGSSLLFAQRAMIAELAIKNRLPSMCTAREWTHAGFVMSYGPSLNDLYRRAPYFIDRILKGAKPAELPVEQPSKFELVMNMKAARALHLAIPSALLLRADEIIQ